MGRNDAQLFGELPLQGEIKLIGVRPFIVRVYCKNAATGIKRAVVREWIATSQSAIWIGQRGASGASRISKWEAGGERVESRGGSPPVTAGRALEDSCTAGDGRRAAAGHIARRAHTEGTRALRRRR